MRYVIMSDMGTYQHVVAMAFTESEANYEMAQTIKRKSTRGRVYIQKRKV